MKKLLIAATAMAVAMPLWRAPAEAQSWRQRQEVRECNRELRRSDSRREYYSELRECRRELDRARQADRRDWRSNRRDWREWSRYDYNRYEPGSGDRYYADRYYRSDPSYRPYRLSRNDRIYRGENGNYYCRRSDGTTGLIVGAALGGLLGNQIGRGDSRVLGTVIGAGAGAAIGASVDRGDVRCN